MVEKTRFEISGYEMLRKVPTNSGTSARIFVPKSWAGKRCVVILQEKAEE
jgi:putative transposon-encoded protein